MYSYSNIATNGVRTTRLDHLATPPAHAQVRDALRTKYGLGAFLRRLRQPEDPEAQGLLQARRAACV